jgi:hypothetical protein
MAHATIDEPIPLLKGADKSAPYLKGHVHKQRLVGVVLLYHLDSPIYQPQIVSSVSGLQDTQSHTLLNFPASSHPVSLTRVQVGAVDAVLIQARNGAVRSAVPADIIVKVKAAVLVRVVVLVSTGD